MVLGTPEQLHTKAPGIVIRALGTDYLINTRKYKGMKREVGYASYREPPLI